uniref:Uncharacterized protein n=1 Tax=Timspurckia oligopyrenoides TaxID=708627 RepID=A0A7S0ZK13_9RHOD|mmetsp:Transcript_7517/g.13585  ORF Transcript_7517/g.13585 Transcript_7517/m.13585 type:complete len:188 (+) Transcript_7517:218-781(+)
MMRKRSKEVVSNGGLDAVKNLRFSQKFSNQLRKKPSRNYSVLEITENLSNCDAVVIDSTSTAEKCVKKSDFMKAQEVQEELMFDIDEAFVLTPQNSCTLDSFGVNSREFVKNRTLLRISDEGVPLGMSPRSGESEMFYSAENLARLSIETLAARFSVKPSKTSDFTRTLSPVYESRRNSQDSCVDFE